MPAIYIHVPFCQRRCNYCDFCSSVSSSETVSAYVDALVRNIRAYADYGLSADSVYFGGGTPSLLTGEQMSVIMSAVCDSFLISSDAEITTEANPNTVDLDKLSRWRDSGINRISFGVQSCKDNELYRLGRLHNFGQAAEAVKLAQRAGFDNISCDLMLGIPEQTIDTVSESVNAVCSLGISHVSAYMLKIEEGTPFDTPSVIDELPSDDEVADMYLLAAETLESRGLQQYEISNFAVSGYESRHNLKYWTLEDYIGFGPSAHSLFNGKRFFVPPDISGFINSERQAVEIEDACPDFLSEYVMLGLRLCKGIELDKLGDKAQNFISGAKLFEAEKLLEIGNGRVRLTRKGFLVSNGIIARLMDFLEK